MKTAVRRVAVSMGAIAFTTAVALPPQAAFADTRPTPRSGYTWAWSDGGTSTNRTFSEAIYGSAQALPRLVVNASCSRGARVGDQIRLQWRNSNRRFVPSDTAKVNNCNGAYRLSFIPYTTSGTWAEGTYKYRLIIPGGGGYKYFTITYQRGRG